MDREDIKLNSDEIKQIISKTDESNCADFSSLQELVQKEYNNRDIFDDISAYLAVELGYSCDADLSDITDDEIDGLVEAINEME